MLCGRANAQSIHVSCLSSAGDQEAKIPNSGASNLNRTAMLGLQERQFCIPNFDFGRKGKYPSVHELGCILHLRHSGIIRTVSY